MGSLMVGWDSPVPDPKSLKYRKNWPFTKGEIDAYWKLKKKIEEEHLRAIQIKLLPEANTMGSLMDVETGKSLEELIKKNGWCSRSNWEFLNEPPVLERSSNTYTAQFHIAKLENKQYCN
ncbi:hypothetical protein P3X46_002120 [Hevea brasiliensis]|uniref:Uncharacterized protein n=1 Tax=Hevea brasiliensis TaxID=3981 RepID=A0ABQ9N5F4_HEVBR|nr:hypothetical protein P3X46_002120 [Hevea brasiliensis]